MANRDNGLDLPDWLKQREIYEPQKDHDGFIHKTLLGLFKLIAQIRHNEMATREAVPFHVPLQVFATLVLMILLSVTQSYAYVLIIGVYVLVRLSLMRPERLLSLIKITIGVSILTSVVMLPAAIMGNHYSLIMIVTKVFITVSLVGLLSSSTNWHALTGALKVFKLPDIFILVLDIAIKYMYLLGEFALQMITALKLKSVGVNQSKYQSLGGIAGNVFLHSREMAEDMYQAMVCRGFTGEYVHYQKQPLKRNDYAYGVLHLLFVLLFIYFERF